MEYYNYLISEINDVIAYIKDELNIKDIIRQIAINNLNKFNDAD